MEITFDYMNAADAMAEKGDYISALHYYFLQRNTDYFGDVDVAIADVYMEMDLINEATKYYMYAYAYDNDNKDALEGLICCFKEFDEEAALYYLHKIALLDEDEFNFDPSDFDLLSRDYEKPTLTVHNRKDKEDVMNEALSKLQSSDIDGAKELLHQIDKGDLQYCDARLALASVALDESDPSKALDLANEALEIDAKHLGSHMIKIMAYELMGDTDKMEEWIGKLEKLDLKSEEDITKTAMYFINFRPDIAIKYLMQKLEFAPYDKMTLICLASAYLKSDKGKAVKYINEACSVFPGDVELKEIAARIYGGKFDMPKDYLELKNEWHSKIKGIFLNKDEDILSPENMRNVKWLLQGDNDLYLQAAVCTYITGMSEYDGIINECLLNPFISDIVKKHILLRRFCDEKQKKVKFVVSNIYRSIRIKHPDVPDNLKNAYYIVLSSLAIEEYNFEIALNRSLKRLRQTYDDLEDREKLSMGGLAVLLRKMTVGGNEEEYCKIYDTDMEEYRAVARKLGFGGDDNVRF